MQIQKLFRRYASRGTSKEKLDLFSVYERRYVYLSACTHAESRRKHFLFQQITFIIFHHPTYYLSCVGSSNLKIKEKGH